MSLRVHAILSGTTVNGPGTRTCVWVQGCSIGCGGCWNPNTWAVEGGTLWDPKALAKHVVEEAAEGTQGLSLSGGEPWQQAPAVLEFVLAVRSLRPSWDVFAWTGYTVEALKFRGAAAVALLEAVDLVVDGPYVAHKAKDNLRWRGSSNQRLVPMTPRGAVMLAEEMRREVGLSEFEIVIDPEGRVVMTGFPADDLPFVSVAQRSL